MAKRRPEKQLTQNNWDDELEKDEGGQFQKADDREMKNRVFRVAKRRIARPADESDAGADSPKPASVFSGFSLVSNKSASDATASKPAFSFGSGFSSQPFGSTVVGSSFGGVSAAAATTTTTIKTDTNKSSEFILKLRELNDGVLKCIKGHIESGKACILTPIFNDYEKYVKELEEKDKNAPSSSSAKANNMTAAAAAAVSTAPAPFTFSFSAAKSATESAGPSASTVTAVPTQSASNTGLFSFNNSKSTTTFGAPSTGFSFSSGFQAPKPVDNDNKGDTNGDTNAEDESDEPPKVEFKPVVEEESIYSKRCKVFVKEGAEFKERGTGTLFLKKVKDDKVQLVVRADTNLGNILLNFLLTSAAPPKRLKNNVMIVCVPTPDADATKPKSVLVRVKTEDDATELLEEIEKYQN